MEPSVASRVEAGRAREESLPDRLDRLDREEEARERFDAALERSGITAAEIEDGVKRLFESIRVEPVLRPSGRLEGMILRELPSGHPFRRAGFANGDRLVRLDGWELEDAAQLPEIFIRLRRSFTACAVRDGAERCREVTVESPTG